MKVKINTDKKIGKVIYVVEGDVDEVKIITKIYNELFGYSVVSYNKKNNYLTMLKSDKDKYSRVYIIPSEHSSISSLEDSKEYLDNIYHKLAIDFELDVENSAIYYIFDRDRDSNRPGKILSLMDKLKNSRENDDCEMNGLLLLSYPCIEAIYCNCKNDNVRLSNGSNAKSYVCEYIKQPFEKQMIESGSSILITKINKILNTNQFDIGIIDSFAESLASLPIKTTGLRLLL